MPLSLSMPPENMFSGGIEKGQWHEMGEGWITLLYDKRNIFSLLPSDISFHRFVSTENSHEYLFHNLSNLNIDGFNNASIKDANACGDEKSEVRFKSNIQTNNLNKDLKYTV